MVAALEVLRETENDGVMWGDAGLLDAIFERWAGEQGVHPLDRWRRVLNALGAAVSRGDPRMTKRVITVAGRPARVFSLAFVCRPRPNR